MMLGWTRTRLVERCASNALCLRCVQYWTPGEQARSDVVARSDQRLQCMDVAVGIWFVRVHRVAFLMYSMVGRRESNDMTAQGNSQKLQHAARP